MEEADPPILHIRLRLMLKLVRMLKRYKRANMRKAIEFLKTVFPRKTETKLWECQFTKPEIKYFERRYQTTIESMLNDYGWSERFSLRI